ncbi:MAG: YggS family pyridoxal phosphate-dependent enzyme [Flammeovirgaceae bacterium]
MTDLKTSIEKIKADLSSSCRLVAVSKTKSVALIQEAYELGLRVFGENKVQELTSKYEELPKDIEWHFIGHLQTNKVKYIAPFVRLIHAVDSLKLLKEINKRAKSNDRTIDCLFQIHVAEESTKFGLDQQGLLDILASNEFQAMENVRMRGIMGMATNTDNQDQIRREFQQLKAIFDHVVAHYTQANIDFQELSMGMSGDYKIAIEEGSTLIRLGSSIFGPRLNH